MQRQRNFGVFLRLLPVMALAFVLTGCTRETAAEAIAKAQVSLQNVESMSYTLAMDMEMTGQGQTMKMTSLAGVDYILEPARMKMEMDASVNGIKGIHTISYMTQDSGTYTLYTGLDNGEEIFWQTMKLENMDSYMQYNAQSNLELYLSCAESFEAAGEETLTNGTETVRYDGIISKDQLEKVIESSGMSSQLENMGFEPSITQNMFRELNDLPICIWIEKDTYMPVQYQMDMTAIMQSMLDGMMDSLGDAASDITVNKVRISMTVQSINDIDHIDIPEDALSAQPSALTGISDMTSSAGQELTDENYQSFFMPAQDLGYRYIGRAYCKAPEGMFENGSFLDAYLPFGDNLTYSEDGQSLWSSAHGMMVLQSTAYTEGNAQTVVDQAYQEFADSGVEFIDGEIGETRYDNSYDIAFKPIAYYEETADGKQPRIAVLYADFKQENYYLYAQITYIPEQFDEQYPDMLEELCDAFGLSLPQYELSDFY